jgi:hypothetical protein
MPAGPGNYDALLALIEATCAAQVPEAHANGIYISLLSLARAIEQQKIPCLLLSISLATDDPHWEDSGPVTLHYVREQGESDVTTYSELIAKAQLLQTALTNLDFADSYVRGKPDIDASRNIALNQYFEESRQPFWSARILFQVVTGEVTP